MNLVAGLRLELGSTLRGVETDLELSVCGLIVECQQCRKRRQWKKTRSMVVWDNSVVKAVAAKTSKMREDVWATRMLSLLSLSGGEKEEEEKKIETLRCNI